MKTIGWNVDTEYDFMRNDAEHKGSLYVAGAELIEPNLARLTDYFRQNGVTILNTADWHTDYSKEISDTPDYKTTFPMHCKQRTKGAEFVPATRPDHPVVIDWADGDFDWSAVRKAKELVLYKDVFNAFDLAGAPHTNGVVELVKPDRAIVYGVTTQICVNYAVEGLRGRGVDVYLVKDAIRDLHTFPADQTLSAWEKLGVKFVTTDNVLRGGLI